MTNSYNQVTLTAPEQGFTTDVVTPMGTFTITGSLSDRDGALVVFIDTTDNDEPLEPTPDVLRVNVNDGPVFNYDDAVNWYGDGQGIEAPILDDDDNESEV